MQDLGALLFKIPRSSGPRWVVYENGQYVSLTRPPKKGTAFLFVDPGHSLQLQTPTGYVIEQRLPPIGARGHEGLVEAKKFVGRAATMLEGRDVNPPTGGNGEPTCPHSATQHMGGECESCYAKRTRQGRGPTAIQSAKMARMRSRSIEGPKPMMDIQRRALEGRRRIERTPKARLD